MPSRSSWAAISTLTVLDLNLFFGGHDHAGHDHADHGHDAYATAELAVPEGLMIEEIEALIRPLDALRVKGFVRAAEGPMVVQGVGRRLELQPLDEPVHPSLYGRVVVITRRAD